MSGGYSSLLRERRLLELVLNTHIRAAAKQWLPPLLLREVTIQQLHSGKTKRKALLKDTAERTDSSWSRARADPLHYDVLLWVMGAEDGGQPQKPEWGGCREWGWWKRMLQSAPSWMPPSTKECRFSENLCHKARLRSAMTLK